MRKIQKLYYSGAAAITVMAMSSDAFAQGEKGVGKIAKNINDSLGGFIDLFSMISYVGGAGLGVGGIMKLKQHVDSPNQVPMKDGLMRLAAAGGLLALPFIVGQFTETVSGSTSTNRGSLSKW